MWKMAELSDVRKAREMIGVVNFKLYVTSVFSFMFDQTIFMINF